MNEVKEKVHQWRSLSALIRIESTVEIFTTIASKLMTSIDLDKKPENEFKNRGSFVYDYVIKTVKKNIKITNGHQ